VSLNLTQPLWRGLRFDENRYRIQVARKNRQLSVEQLRQRVIEVVTQAVQRVLGAGLRRPQPGRADGGGAPGRAQYHSNRGLAEQGILAPVDVVAAQTQVATFQQLVFARSRR
jgi:hypothetical protein